MRTRTRIGSLVLMTLVALGAVLSLGVSPASAESGHVTVPSNYVYNPNTSYQRTLHDYCSYSPDEFSTIGQNANFRGPCARHDLCYQYNQKTRSGCDNQLLAHLLSECSYTYAFYDPRRASCYQTAGVYWGAVTAHTIWP